ncbi:MAG: restriction endonuclease subunit S [Opitutales bacterium]|nr:restriction endonuclease subunit S [Opitutales bacterium]
MTATENSQLSTLHYQLKKGYKQTEVGVIPEDWEVVTIGDICSFLSGGTPSRKNKDFWNGDIPWISATSLRCFDIYKSENNVTKEAVERGSKFAPIHSTLILVRGSALHKEILAGLVSKKVCFNQDVKALVPNTKLFPKFLTFSILGNSHKLLNLVTSAGNTAGVLDTRILKSFLIPLPTKTEQEAIAEALSDADAWIASLEQLIAKKRRIKEGTLQALLTPPPPQRDNGKLKMENESSPQNNSQLSTIHSQLIHRRLPGFDSEWVEKRLGEVLEVAHGRSQHKVENSAGAYPILASGGLIGRSNEFLYNRPSVLIGRKGTIDRPQYMDTPFWTVDTLFYTKIYNPNDAKFLFYRFCLIPWRKYNEASGVPSLNAATIEDIEISLPSQTEQTAIATVLSDMDAEIDALETKLTKARLIKKGMMEELLTGKTRFVNK